MNTVQLNVSDSGLEKLLEFINSFQKSEIELIDSDQNFLKNRSILQRDLKEIESEELLSETEFDQIMDDEIKFCENKI